MNTTTNSMKETAMFPGARTGLHGHKGYKEHGDGLAPAHGERHVKSHGAKSLEVVTSQMESVRVSLSKTTMSFSSSASINMDQFYQELSSRMGLPATGSAANDKLNNAYAASGAEVVSVPPISAQQVADNILGFVGKRLEAEASGGASKERLAELMGQARSGVEQGFSEAKEQIEALGMMSDTLGDDIGQSFKLVNEGLDALEKRFLGERVATEQLLPTQSSVTPQAATASAETRVSSSQAETSSSVRNNAVKSGPASYQSGYSKQVGFDEALNLNVRTRDGDIVSISLRETGYSSESMQYAKNSGGEAAAYEKGVYFSGEYSYQIEGDLDEGELAALNDLFDQVNEVAGLFYEGDFNDAFAYAMEMGYDSSELASFSLNMTQTQMTQVSAYEKASGERANRPSLAPFGKIASPALHAIESASKISSDMSLLLDSLDFMLADKGKKAHGSSVDKNLQKNNELAHQYSEMINNLVSILPEHLRSK